MDKKMLELAFVPFLISRPLFFSCFSSSIPRWSILKKVSFLNGCL